ncbi:hypothetical protein HanPSC8_Chr12g0541211 [Helianthus annuus]|nr:hypothetical protein HanPSC8_Chr12g0541211 [Helianthus annuus]
MFFFFTIKPQILTLHSHYYPKFFISHSTTSLLVFQKQIKRREDGMQRRSGDAFGNQKKPD